MSAWPQYTVAAYYFVSLVMLLARDRTETTMMDRVTGILSSFIVTAAIIGVLWAGGFWHPLFG